ncbi:MAG: leucyl/phenylalanyl-tRNA--protein transferase [Desulfobulbaceae bacterium]|nr:leucyl/phenylalanyl-tRNA--protein transferase [Desulfobulbaceae bacterium]HIJ79143.1 leucyl/phenylalanyl-tRNA--protein transferase [Deltaproteobacteria bacterium]
MPVFQLTESLLFPPPELAEADGLLAVGGDLSPERLLMAYRAGIFPWYSPGDPILWWSPDPRLVLFPDEFYLSKRLARTIRQKVFEVTFDTAFKEVIANCANLRNRTGEGTWIDEAMQEAYCRLHELGFAHSVECRQDGKLVGGLYGVAIGSIFFGESMFSLTSNSSKVAMATLVAYLKKKNFDLIDCQIGTPHLKSLGARDISGDQFSQLLAEAVNKPTPREPWQLP